MIPGGVFLLMALFLGPITIGQAADKTYAYNQAESLYQQNRDDQMKKLEQLRK
jgi:hypothetical protein